MDKRKLNGGNSTKAKGVDKRKNALKEVIGSLATEQDIIDVLMMARDKAIHDKDIKAAQLFLEYTVGKPTQQTDITTAGEKINQSIQVEIVQPDEN